MDDQPWDMNRPLENGCTLKFLHFKDPKPYQSNLVKRKTLIKCKIIEIANLKVELLRHIGAHVLLFSDA